MNCYFQTKHRNPLRFVTISILICAKLTTRNFRCCPVRNALSWTRRPAASDRCRNSFVMEMLPITSKGRQKTQRRLFYFYQHAGVVGVLYSRCWPVTGLSQNYYGWLNWLTVTAERMLASEHHHQLNYHFALINILTYQTDLTITYSSLLLVCHCHLFVAGAGLYLHILT